MRRVVQRTAGVFALTEMNLARDSKTSTGGVWRVGGGWSARQVRRPFPYSHGTRHLPYDRSRNTATARRPSGCRNDDDDAAAGRHFMMAVIKLMAMTPTDFSESRWRTSPSRDDARVPGNDWISHPRYRRSYYRNVRKIIRVFFELNRTRTRFDAPFPTREALVFVEVLAAPRTNI